MEIREDGKTKKRGKKEAMGGIRKDTNKRKIVEMGREGRGTKR